MKAETKEELNEKLGWEDYGIKHTENIYTRFYQGHILPIKFGIDKRRAFFSSLINAGQMKRGEALELLREDFYSTSKQQIDMAFICSMLDISDEELEEIMDKPEVPHGKYSYPWFDKLRFLTKIARKVAIAS